MTATCHRRLLAGYLPDLGAIIEQFLDLRSGANPRTPVPSCPDWDVAALTEHVGTIHRWAAHMVRTKSQERAQRSDVDLALPDSPDGQTDWFAAGAAILRDAVAQADPDAPMWSWGSDRHARFWARRMVHETGVHLADLAGALGAPFTLPEGVAADGIDELLDNLPHAAYFAPVVDELRGNGETITFSDPGSGLRWRIELGPDGYRWGHDDADGDADLAAPAAELLLVVYSRLPLDAATVTGRRELVEHWVTHSSL